MDPNYFSMDFERVGEVLLAIVVISMLMERALALLFDSRFWIEKVSYKVQRKPATTESASPLKPDMQPLESVERKAPSFHKEGIALAVAFFICYFWKFDALSVIMPVHEDVTWQGMLITAGIIAGGSKASVKLFKDWLDISSSASKEIDNYKKANKAD